jgi:hypothetical protein
MIYIIWDFWKVENIYYCLVYKGDTLYFYQSESLKNLENINGN